MTSIVSPASRVGERVALASVMRSEWIKLRSLRSVWFTVAMAVGAIGLFGLLNALTLAREWNGADAASRANLDAVASLMGGWFLSQLIVGSLGVLAVTSEYASGSMRGTLAAVPSRTTVLVAKLVVPTGITVAVLLPATLVTFWLGGLLLPTELRPSLGDDGVARSVLATSLCLGVICMIGTAIGFALRSTAASIGLLVTVLLIAPGLAAGFSDALYTYVPGGAIDAILTVNPETVELPLVSPGAGIAILSVHATLAIAAGAWLLRRRDA